MVSEGLSGLEDPWSPEILLEVTLTLLGSLTRSAGSKKVWEAFLGSFDLVGCPSPESIGPGTLAACVFVTISCDCLGPLTL